MRQLLISAGLLLPLALDTFALATALGMAGLPARDRIRVTLVFTAFEAVMPVIGIVVGRAAGALIGEWAGYGGIAFVAIAGVLLLWPGRDEGGEERRVRLLAHARGIAILDLGLSISMDELAIGLSAGLLRIPLAAAIAWIAVQALLATQLGLRLGSRVSERVRERAEWLAGVILLVMAAALLVLRLLRL